MSTTFIVALLLLLRLQLQTSEVQQSLRCLAWKIALVVTTTIRSGVIMHCRPAFALAAKRGRFSPVRHDDDMILD